MPLSLLNRWSSRLASQMRPGVGLIPAKRSNDDDNDTSKEEAAATTKTTMTPPPKHHLILYEYEASPWCRLVREYATILNLSIHIRPCPRQTLFLEGAYDSRSRFRPEAMEYLQTYQHTDDLTFPLLVDKTKEESTNDDPIVIHQSYDILVHLWERYGQTVLPNERRPDKFWNSNQIPFPIRFLSLASPSYFRLSPTCGILQSPSRWTTTTTEIDKNNNNDQKEKELYLYQVEGCPESRLVRETLCTLEIPYLSIPTTTDVVVRLVDGDRKMEGADMCCDYLWKEYHDERQSLPTWWNMPLKEKKKNIGKSGSFGVGAYTAFLRGSRAFVPEQALR